MQRSLRTPGWLAMLTTAGLVGLTPPAVAELKPGDKLDKSNCQEARGLLPEHVLEKFCDGQYSAEIIEVKDEALANSSEGLFGSTLSRDDAHGWGGKIQYMNWKLIGVQDMLVPIAPSGMEKAILPADPAPKKLPPDPSVIKNRGQIPPGQVGRITYSSEERVTLGYETPGWQGIAWAPTNIKLAKRKCWVVEATPKVFVQDGVLVYVYNFFGKERVAITSSEKIPIGKATVRYKFTSDGGKPGSGGTGRLFINGKHVGEGRIEPTVPFRISLDETFDVGEDTGTPVTETYTVPFKFTGKLEKVTVELQ